MRRHAHYARLALALWAAAASGGALAQGSTDHLVAVTIPQVLRLKLDDGRTEAQGAVPIRVAVAGDTTRIDPESTQIEVWANSSWQLSVTYTPTEPHDALRLQVRVEDGGPWLPLRAYPQVVASGRSTGGWRPLVVAYGVAGTPPEGDYAGLVTFTLARP